MFVRRFPFMLWRSSCRTSSKISSICWFNEMHEKKNCSRFSSVQRLRRLEISDTSIAISWTYTRLGVLFCLEILVACISGLLSRSYELLVFPCIDVPVSESLIHLKISKIGIEFNLKRLVTLRPIIMLRMRKYDRCEVIVLLMVTLLLSRFRTF